jgi:plastocyanin
MRSHRVILFVLAFIVLLAPSLSAQHHPVAGKVDYDPEPGGGEPTAPGCPGVQNKVTINATSTTFSPATITVDAGQPVCWTWSDTPVAHNIKSDDGSFSSGPPGIEGTFQRTFNTPGTYNYYCQVHGTLTAGMRATVIVRDAAGGGGEGPGTLQLASTTYTVNEGEATLNVSVERAGGSDGAASVKYGTTPGTAKNGKDFLPRTGTLRWANGDAEPKTIQVPIKNDGTAEPDEGFSVKLSKATGSTLGTAVAAVNVKDDDGGAGCPAALSALSLSAIGESAGEIRVEWDEMPTPAKVFHIERRTPGGTFRTIASVAPDAGSFNDAGLPAAATFQYRIRGDGAADFSKIVAGATDGSAAACDDTRSICLGGGRFEATVEWGGSPAEKDREARGVMLSEAPGSGLFSRSANESLALLLNVHDGCATNDHFWLDLAAVTDEEFTVRVRDTQTGRTWIYFNEAGNAPAPVRDVEAFKTCP